VCATLHPAAGGSAGEPNRPQGDVTWANGTIPTDLVCLPCVLAAFNQTCESTSRSAPGPRDSVFAFSRSYGIFIGPAAVDPVNVNNRVIRY
jgi:hypothetical protein